MTWGTIHVVQPVHIVRVAVQWKAVGNPVDRARHTSILSANFFTADRGGERDRDREAAASQARPEPPMQSPDTYPGNPQRPTESLRHGDGPQPSDVDSPARTATGRTDPGVTCEAFAKGLESMRRVRWPLGPHRGRGRRVLPALQPVHRCAAGTPAPRSGSPLPFRARGWPHGSAGAGGTAAPRLTPLPGPKLGTDPATTRNHHQAERRTGRSGKCLLPRNDPGSPSGTSRTRPSLVF